MTIADFWAWRRAHPKWFEFFVSVLTGVLIEIALIAFQPPALYAVRKFADDSADKMIRLAERTTERIERSPAFVFIDVDDATSREWGFPLITPRDKLARLIEIAARSQALEIVVDVDLSYRDDAGRLDAPAASNVPKSQDALARVFNSYPLDGPPLVLDRALKPNADTKAVLPELRRTDYDAVTQGHDNIAWGSPLFERSGDNIVRRWELFAPVCGPFGQPLAVPSIHLLAANIARRSLAGAHRADPDPWAALQRNLGAFPSANCATRSPAQEGILDDTPGLQPIAVKHDDVSSRVIYRIAWRPDAAGLGPRVRVLDGADSPAVAVRPARSILAADGAEGAPGLAGRVVVIGGSFAESGDWHETPIGRMPGALLIVNAIEALSVNGTPIEPGKVERVITSLGIVVLTAAAATWLRASVAAIAVAAGLLVLMTISIARFESGVMLDLAIPAVGAALHDLIEAVAALLKQMKNLGWRWLLKPEVKSGADAAPKPPEDAPAHAEPSS